MGENNVELIVFIIPKPWQRIYYWNLWCIICHESKFIINSSIKLLGLNILVIYVTN